MNSFDWTIFAASLIVGGGLVYAGEKISNSLREIKSTLEGISLQLQPRMPLQASIYAVARAIYALEGKSGDTPVEAEQALFQEIFKNEARGE